MDYISHGLWSYIFFNKIKTPALAVFFGLLPDTTSWFIYTVYRFVEDGSFGKPDLNNIPHWVFVLYNISHSLIVALAVIFFVFIIWKRVPIYIWAWPIAVVMDVLTHTREFLPTPFLWPTSDWRFPGIRWGNRTFMIINYSIILVCLLIIFWRKRDINKSRRKNFRSR